MEEAIFFEPPYQTKPTGNPSLPEQGPVVNGKWQGWNALEGGWWSNSGLYGTPGSGVEPLSEVLEHYTQKR